MWQDPEQRLADSFPCISRGGRTRTFSSQDTNDAATKSLNINKSELVGSELLETMGSHPFLHPPHVSLRKLPNYVAIGRTLSNPLHFT